MNFLSYASWMEVRVTDNNFEREHLRTIYAMFALNWLTGFRGEDLNNFPIGPMLKLCPLTAIILDRDRGH